jgi:hypothetical protein
MVLTACDLHDTWWTSLDIASVRGPAKDPFHRTKGQSWPAAVDKANRLLFTQMIGDGGREPTSWFLLAIGEKLIVASVEIEGTASISDKGDWREFSEEYLRALIDAGRKVIRPNAKPLRWLPVYVNNSDAVFLYRPIGPAELELIREAGFKKWPPRLPGQPIFYPVTNRQYAVQIARDWNVKSSGAGFVTRFRVRPDFMQRYPIRTVGDSAHTEWWIPAEDLQELNDNIVGIIEVIDEFHSEQTSTNQSKES